MRALSVLLVGLLLQDPADKVRPLVEKLGSDEIAVREDAAAQLVKLGPGALPAIREQLGKAEGERKVRLQAVVKKIEREVILEKVLGAVPVVTLKVRDAPVEEALAEMARQTGLKIEGFFLDSSFRTTASFDRVPLWKAIDDLCRSHGGIISLYKPNGILVEPGQRDAPPVLMDRGFGFLVRRAFRWEDGRVELQVVLAHSPRLPLWSTRLKFEALEDDKGTSLAAEKVEPRFVLGSTKFASQTRPGQFAVLLSHVSAAGAGEGAKRLARVRGQILVGLALDLKPLVTLPDPLKQEKSSANANGCAVEIKSVLRGPVIRLRVSVELPKAEEGGPRWTLALRDNGGELHMGRVVADLFEEDEVTVEVAVPEGREIVSFELLEPEELTEISIPFDFADVPIAGK